jgi:hypothetical protein
MFSDLPRVVWSRCTHRKDLAMTSPEAAQPEAELDSESSTDEATTDVNETTDVDEESSDSGYDPEAATEEGVAADYQERLREFDAVDTVPVASVPVRSSELDESDLEVQPPGGQSG